MANSIVFQSQAEQLKSAVYGYDGSNYRPLAVTSSGQLNIGAGTITEISEVGSIKGGTITTVTDVAEIGSLKSGTVTIDSIVGGTITTVSTVTSVIDVEELGSLKSGTVTIDSIVGGTVTTVSTVTSVTDVEELGSIKGGTITTVTSVTDVQELGSIKGGTINATIASRNFTETGPQYVSLAVNGTNTSAYIDISRYQDTSWYIRNVSGTATIVTVQIAVTPTTAEPYVLINETATVGNNAKVITNAYYMKLAKVYCDNLGSSVTQTIKIYFNGRY